MHRPGVSQVQWERGSCLSGLMPYGENLNRTDKSIRPTKTSADSRQTAPDAGISEVHETVAQAIGQDAKTRIQPHLAASYKHSHSRNSESLVEHMNRKRR